MTLKAILSYFWNCNDFKQIQMVIQVYTSISSEVQNFEFGRFVLLIVLQESASGWQQTM